MAKIIKSLIIGIVVTLIALFVGFLFSEFTIIEGELRLYGILLKETEFVSILGLFVFVISYQTYRTN